MQANTLAKLQSPVVDNVVFRKRLFHALEQARKKKAIWITGQPGSGKTTLIASYLSARKLPHAWYHIDSSDMDLATFFYYLKLLVQMNNGGKSSRLSAFAPEYLPNISAYAQRYFENLYAMLPKGFVLVFDNYHEVDSNPLFHSIMQEALMKAPDHGNIIVISRTEPPDTFSRIRANSMMDIIGNEQIRFTPEETGELIRLRSGESYTHETVKKLHDLTDGWAAGVILMLERDKEKLDVASQKEFKDNQDIFDYFTAEIFDRLAPDMQNFLLKTCLFPSMTADMANRMTMSNDAERLLNMLVRSQYFTIKHQDNRYSYHDLFRVFLLTRVQASFSEAKLNQIYKRAAVILKANDNIEDAMVLFQKAGDWENTRQIIKANARNLINQGRNMVLETWIKKLPEEELNNDPWLLYWFGEAQAVFSPVQGRSFFEKSFNRFLSKGLDAGGLYPVRKKLSNGVYLAWCGIIETFIYEYGNFALINKWVVEMEKIIRAHHKFPSRDLEERILSLLVFAVTHYNPFHPKIKFWADRTLQLLKQSRDPDQFISYSFSIVHYYAWIGDVCKMQTLVALMQKIPQSSSIKNQLLQMMYRAGYARQIVSREECLRTVSEGMEMAHKYGVRFLDNMILSQAVYLLFAVNDLKGVENFLQKMGPTVNESNALQVSQYTVLSGWLDHLQGNTSLALDKIERSLALSIKAHIPFAQSISRLALAQILYDRGDYKKAEKHYKLGFRIAKGMRSKSLEFTSYWIQAYRHLAEDNTNNTVTENTGLKMLKKCMVLGKKNGMVNVYFAWGQKMASVCLKALENDIEVPYVQHLIHKLDLFPDTPPYSCRNWPWMLKVYTLGNLKILRDNAPLELPKKARLKPVELLQFLIVYHGKAVELDHISGVLWPDAPGDYAHQTLDTTIHRLRKLLGSSDAIIAEAGRLMLNPKTCWVDVQAVDVLCTRLEALLHGGAASMKQAARDRKIRELGRQIFHLYKEDFFAHGPLPSWALNFRDSLHDRFIRFIEMFGSYYEENSDTAQAVRIYRKGLEIDNQAELFYQRLMLLYQSHGRTAEAVAVYQHCSTVLSRTLGIEPSGKTKEIYHGIVKSTT